MRCIFWSRGLTLIGQLVEAAEENKNVEAGKFLTNASRQEVTSFVSNYLKCDGRFLVALLLESHNTLVVTEVGMYELMICYWFCKGQT